MKNVGFIDDFGHFYLLVDGKGALKGVIIRGGDDYLVAVIRERRNVYGVTITADGCEEYQLHERQRDDVHIVIAGKAISFDDNLLIIAVIIHIRLVSRVVVFSMITMMTYIMKIEIFFSISRITWIAQYEGSKQGKK